MVAAVQGVCEWDDDILVCNELDSETWEGNFLHQLGQEAEPEEVESVEF